MGKLWKPKIDGAAVEHLSRGSTEWLPRGGKDSVKAVLLVPCVDREGGWSVDKPPRPAGRSQGLGTLHPRILTGQSSLVPSPHLIIHSPHHLSEVAANAKT